MTKPRKLWKVTQGLTDGARIDPSTEQRPESKAKVYEIYVPNATRAHTHDFVDVWVDERNGRGCQLYEHIDLDDMRTEPAGENPTITEKEN